MTEGEREGRKEEEEVSYGGREGGRERRNDGGRNERGKERVGG